MSFFRKYVKIIGLLSFLVGLPSAEATVVFDSVQTQIGLPQLLAVNPLLTGAGVAVSQVEAPLSGGDYFEPDISKTGNSSLIFTFVNGSGIVSSTQDTAEISAHASIVGQLFYGVANGISPGVSQVYVFDVNDEYLTMAYGNSLIPTGQTHAPVVVNQSFVFPGEDSYGIAYLDSLYDDYAVVHNTLFISAIGDGGPSYATGTSPVAYVNPPSDQYNGIGVAALNGGSGYGPTYDGRSKPDLTAPGDYTSYTTPIVSGSATLLIQAALGGLGGPAVTDSTDIRTIKALLLNGAVRPTGWTNSYSSLSGVYTYDRPTAYATTPLDPRYGAGVVNVYNSYLNLTGGEHHYSSSDQVALTSLPPTIPVGDPVEVSRIGWDFNSVGAGELFSGVNNYVFTLPGKSSLSATLVWNRDLNQTGINHLYFYLISSSGIIASSTSLVDNTQYLYVSDPLQLGTYDLAVEMLGGNNALIPIGQTGVVEQYSVAWAFTAVPEDPSLILFVIGILAIVVAGRRS